MIDEQIRKYVDNADADDIGSIRNAVRMQFGQDYCIISTNAAFRILTTAFYLSQRKSPLSAEMCRELGEILGSEAQPALKGAGFGADDAVAMVKALREDARDNHD